MKAKKFLSTLLAGALALSSMSMVFADENVELPVADTTKLDVQQIKVAADEYKTLQMGMNFTATETAEEVDGKVYENSPVDFWLTFDRDVNAEDIILAGYYGEYCDKYNDGNWVLVPMPEGTVIEAGSTISVMDLFAESGVIDLDQNYITYYDVVSFVKSFDCGVVFADDADIKALGAELSLMLEVDDSWHQIDSFDFTYGPVYEMTEIAAGEKVTVAGEDYYLGAGAVFTAKQTAEEVDGTEYADYKADFVISFNKDVAADDVMLVGSYEGYENGAWIELPTEGFKANEEVGLMAGLNVEFTYLDILNLVQEFSCGVVSKVDGLEATLKLNVYDEKGDVYVAGDPMKFTVEALPTAEVSDISGIDVTVGGEAYVLNAGAKFTAKEKAEEVDGKFYEDYKADFVVTFDKDVAAEDVKLVGSYAGYENGAWIELPTNGFTANEPVGLMATLGATFTYADVLTLVNEFECGVITNETVNVTVDLVLYDADGEEVVIDTFEKSVDTVNWVTGADSGVSDTYKGVVRFLFNAITNNDVVGYGVKFAKSSDITETLTYKGQLDMQGDAKIFATDLYGIEDNATYYALAYVKVGDEYYWTNTPVAATVDYNNVLVDYVVK